MKHTTCCDGCTKRNYVGCLNADCRCHTPITSSWEEEFEAMRPEKGWMPHSLERSEQESPVKPFGYKWCSGSQIHEVTDWGNIKAFIAEKIAEAERQAMLRQRHYDQKLIDDAFTAREEEYRKQIGKIMPGFWSSEFDSGYTEAIEHVLKLLNKKDI